MNSNSANGIPNPLEQMKTARSLLVFAAYISDLARTGALDASKFNRDIIYNGLIIHGRFNSNEIHKSSDNLLLCVLGNCFVVIDEALNQIFGKKPSVYSDSDIDALRAIVYMLRCAISHGPTAPCWKVKTKYHRTFRIDAINYELNVGELDGKIIKHGQYGGLPGALSLIDYSIGVASR